MMTSRLIGLCMGLGAAVALADPVPVAMLDETDMFPFVPSYDAPENVVNMSHLLDALEDSGRLELPALEALRSHLDSMITENSSYGDYYDTWQG